MLRDFKFFYIMENIILTPPYPRGADFYIGLKKENNFGFRRIKSSHKSLFGECKSHLGCELKYRRPGVCGAGRSIRMREIHFAADDRRSGRDLLRRDPDR